MIKSLANSSITNEKKYRSMMAGSVENNADHLITETVLGSTTASVTFDVSSLAALGYKHLQLRIVARDNRASEDNTNSIYFNGDATYTNYRSHYLQGYSTSATSGTLQQATAYALAAPIKSANATAYSFSAAIVDIMDFSSTNKNKTVRTIGGEPNSGICLWSGLWMSTSAITSITIQPFISASYVAGSRFSLYASKG